MAQLIADPFRAARLVLRLRQGGITNTAVLSAMEAIDRGWFSPEGVKDLAWEDMSLPLPCGQNLPPPGIVARMVDALALAEGQEGRTLLVGAGSGYTAAILAQVSTEVVTVDRYKSLVGLARDHLAANDILNVRVEQGDGLAAREDGHFDSILGMGLLEADNAAVLSALTPGGRAVFARTGGPAGQQHIAIYENGAWRMGSKLSVALDPFVPGVAKVL